MYPDPAVAVSVVTLNTVPAPMLTDGSAVVVPKPICPEFESVFLTKIRYPLVLITPDAVTVKLL
jgi:hypothetical protein